MAESDLIVSGSACLTDNWLLQNAAELLAREVDPREEAEWLELTPSGGLDNRPISSGAIQILCLTSLIEQVVFCESMYVMKYWIDSWSGLSGQIDSLLSQKMVKSFDPDQPDTSRRAVEYRQTLCRTDELAREAATADAAFRSGESSFIGQVLNGTAPYLAQADSSDLSYVPHPVRARFLDQVLYRTSKTFDSRDMLNEVVNTSRIKLSQRIGHDSSVSTLTSRMSSIALLCLQESSQQSPPMETALQLRDVDEFRRLRSVLHEMQVSMAANNDVSTKKSLNLARNLESAIREVERQLKLRPLDSGDGISEIAVWKGMKLQIPEPLRRPLIAPRHTTAMNRLVMTGAANARKLFDRSLGISDPQVVEDLSMFVGLTEAD